MNATNLVVAGKHLVVGGYGWCGKGVAMRAKGMGAIVTVTEVDPVKAIEARMDGFEVKPMAEAVKTADIVMTVTGCKDIITEKVLANMKDGCVMGNVGHFDNEINKKDLDAMTVSKEKARDFVDRYTVNAVPANGYSSGDAIKAVKETAATSLPKGYGYDFGSITREENQQSNTTIIIFGICILMIYLILSALYESFLVPFAVILSVPMGLMGSFLFAKFMGLENNIYLQTGLIMLIGLLAKTAILLTEYATQRRLSGMSLTSAALSAAKVRLRPILMTALTMIFGLLPLIVSNGVGANGNRSLGTGAVGGMLIGTLALLFIVPCLFITFQYLQEKLRPIQFERSLDWQVQEEVKEAAEERKEYLDSKK